MLPFSILLASMTLTNAADVASAVSRGVLDAEFALEGTLTVPRSANTAIFVIEDHSGGCSLRDTSPLSDPRILNLNKTGNRVAVTGKTERDNYGIPCAKCSEVRLLARETPPAPTQITVSDIVTGKYDYRTIRVNGIVREVFRDEVDPNWIYLSIVCGNESIYAAFGNATGSADETAALVDAEVSAVGVYMADDNGSRRTNRNTMILSGPDAITVVRPAPEDPFDLPLIDTSSRRGQTEIYTLGKMRLSGWVIAVWNRNTILLQDGKSDVHRIRFRSDALPGFGQHVDIVGFPETDLFRINFSDAIWRLADDARLEPPKAIDTTVTKIIASDRDRVRISPQFHGRPVRLTGTIMDVPTKESLQGIITLRDGQLSVPVDVSANPVVLDKISVGCTAAISGTCVVETETWQPHSAFPHTTGIRLVVRTPEDVIILSRPPWWTPQRLMIVVGILLIVIVIVFIWNRILQRIIDKKSRLLLKEQVGQIRATLRVDERTRLAVELHDTLSQNLSGVACQIAATRGTLPDGADETARYLETAERMLLSCRTELRRCLWDLRGDALEETNFTEAIRKTLAPVAIGVETIIRFNVPRSRLSDTTAHGVLCIIRELVANAIRHGKAKAVRIAGEFHDGVLSFSVRDDGRGFDPSNCNGPAEGHFGLEGIRERIKHLDGTFSITSEIGKGTRAEVTLSSSQPNNEEAET